MSVLALVNMLQGRCHHACLGEVVVSCVVLECLAISVLVENDHIHVYLCLAWLLIQVVL